MGSQTMLWYSPIAALFFTMAGSNDITINGVFTDAAALTSTGTYNLVNGKFTANGSLPAGSQGLFAKFTRLQMGAP
jgi:hypothetical protein